MARRWRKNSETCSGERRMPRTNDHSSMSDDHQRDDGASAATISEVSMR